MSLVGISGMWWRYGPMDPLSRHGQSDAVQTNGDDTGWFARHASYADDSRRSDLVAFCSPGIMPRRGFEYYY